MRSRRDFLTQAVAGSALFWDAARIRAHDEVTAAPKPLRLLILGGTGFIGPHYVRAAVARGHKVTIFNRGKSAAGLPPGVERLVGDRNGSLDAIKNRDWDAVLDLAVFVPAWVRSVGEAIRDKVRHYTFVSTTDVYDYESASFKDYGGSEGSALVEYTDKTDPFGVTDLFAMGEDYYGRFKVISEREAERQFPDRTLIVRPGYIVGPLDRSLRFPYWVARIHGGGEVLALGAPSDPYEVIDARDLASWTIRAIERGETGAYNMTGPSVRIGDALQQVASAVRASPKLTWVSSAWLQQQQKAGTKLFLPLPESWSEPAVMQVSSEKARRKGLRCRALTVTAADTLDWYQSLPVEKQRFRVGFDSVRKAPELASLAVLMQQEAVTLHAWHSEKLAIS